MARRKGTQPTITLFSFQDIITSVSGILVFITLLLALELVERVEGRPDNSLTKLAAELFGAVRQATAERDRLAEITGRSAQALNNAVERSPLVLEQESRKTALAIASLKQEIEELEARSDGTEQRLREATAREPEAQAQRALQRSLQAEVENLKRELDGIRDEDRVYVNVSGGPVREGWVVEVGRAQILAAPLSRAGKPRVFDANTGLFGNLMGDAATRALLKWLDDENPGQYVLLLIRPSGHSRFDEIQQHFKDQARPFGFDLIGESQMVIDPERGVFRR